MSNVRRQTHILVAFNVARLVATKGHHGTNLTDSYGAREEPGHGSVCGTVDDYAGRSGRSEDAR